MRVFVVIGTRPEAIKMLPLVRELRKYGEFETKICFSGQHKEMAKSAQFFLKNGNISLFLGFYPHFLPFFRFFCRFFWGCQDFSGNA